MKLTGYWDLTNVQAYTQDQFSLVLQVIIHRSKCFRDKFSHDFSQVWEVITVRQSATAFPQDCLLFQLFTAPYTTTLLVNVVPWRCRLPTASTFKSKAVFKCKLLYYIAALNWILAGTASMRNKDGLVRDGGFWCSLSRLSEFLSWSYSVH